MYAIVSLHLPSLADPYVPSPPPLQQLQQQQAGAVKMVTTGQIRMRSQAVVFLSCLLLLAISPRAALGDKCTDDCTKGCIGSNPFVCRMTCLFPCNDNMAMQNSTYILPRITSTSTENFLSFHLHPSISYSINCNEQKVQPRARLQIS